MANKTEPVPTRLWAVSRLHQTPGERPASALGSVLERMPMLRPVDATQAAERRLWCACELCTNVEYRLDGCPDPRNLADAEIAAWSQRGLSRDEALGDPIDMHNYQPCWIVIDGERVGSIALMVLDFGWIQPSLWVSSLYLFRECRRQGHASRVIANLEDASRRLGLAGIRLDTSWLWQSAVRFYLRRGFWVVNWKHGLSLGRRRTDPDYRVAVTPTRMDFLLSGEERPLISARRDGTTTLVWDEQAIASRQQEDGWEPFPAAMSTFALWLAVSGWPLIRDGDAWERRYHWSDVGMPEGLAYKITVFEGYARHCGFRIDTPRIPGLVYPSWETL